MIGWTKDTLLAEYIRLAQLRYRLVKHSARQTAPIGEIQQVEAQLASIGARLMVHHGYTFDQLTALTSLDTEAGVG